MTGRHVDSHVTEKRGHMLRKEMGRGGVKARTINVIGCFVFVPPRDSDVMISSYGPRECRKMRDWEGEKGRRQ